MKHVGAQTLLVLHGDDRPINEKRTFRSQKTVGYLWLHCALIGRYLWIVLKRRPKKLHPRWSQTNARQKTATNARASKDSPPFICLFVCCCRPRVLRLPRPEESTPLRARYARNVRVHPPTSPLVLPCTSPLSTTPPPSLPPPQRKKKKKRLTPSPTTTTTTTTTQSPLRVLLFESLTQEHSV